MFPHELLEAYVREHLGRRTQLFGSLVEDLFRPLVLGMTDQLSIYTYMRSFAQLRVGAVTLREGDERSYILAALTDHGGPLRLQAATERYDIVAKDWLPDFIGRVNGRRWNFIDRYFHDFFVSLLTRVATVLTEYYQRKPHCVPVAGIFRFLEGVDATTLCIEIDDRAEYGPKEQASRYRVQ